MDLKSRFQNQNVVITGGSSGIGWEMARRFGQLGACLHLIARNPEKLKTAAGQLKEALGTDLRIKTWSADVADQKAIATTLDQIAAEGGIHTLINNAGISKPGYFGESALASMEKVMQVNYHGTVYATQAAWPHLKKAKNGLLGFVSSVAGYTGIIGFPAYSASKFAVSGLAESLRMEGIKEGIGVTILFPPDTDTPLLAQEAEGKPWETVAVSEGASILSTEAVVEKFMKGVRKGRFEVTCNFTSRLIQMVKGIAPRLYYAILDGMVRKAGKKRGSV